MKIAIDPDLTITSWNKKTIIGRNEILSIQIMSGRKYNFPSIFRNILKNPPILKYIIIKYRDKEITISHVDYGFSMVVPFLESLGWKFDDVIRQSLLSPHVRFDVYKNYGDSALN